MNKKEWWVAVPVIAGVAACFMGFLHGMQVENSFDGIAALRALKTPAGVRVGVVAGNALHVLDAEGNRLARQDAHALGLMESPNDMDLTLDAQGRMEAWFFEDSGAGARVLRCGWDESLRRMAPCAVAASGGQLKWDPRSRAVHLAVDRAGERMFIADAKSARVQVFDLAGRRLASSDPDTLPLYFPNRLRYLGDDRLAIADNDHYRIVWADVKTGKPPRFTSSLYAADHPQSRSGRRKVTDMAFGDAGTIWMLAVKQGQKDGDVLVFDAQRKPVARAQLSDDADPLVIESLGDTALVGDYSLVMLSRVDAQGRSLGEFGDAAFRAELAPMRKLSRQAGWWTRGSLVGGGVLIAAGLLLAWRFGERASPKVLQEVRAAPAQEDDPFGGPRFPVELEPTPAFIASMRRQAWILGAVMALAVGMLVVAFVIMRPTAPVTIAQAGLMLLSGAGLTWMFAREIVQPARLRITATHVALFRDGRCVVEVPLADVYATERMLLLGTKRVIYRLADPQRGKIPPTYDLEALRSALLSRLPESHLVDDATFNKHAIGRQPLWIKASALGVLLVIVLFMLREVAAI